MQLLEQFSQKQVSEAIEKSLLLNIAGYDGVKNILYQMSEEKQRCDELNIEQRWPQLSCYKVKVNTESYNQLLRKE